MRGKVFGLVLLVVVIGGVAVMWQKDHSPQSPITATAPTEESSSPTVLPSLDPSKTEVAPPQEMPAESVSTHLGDQAEKILETRAVTEMEKELLQEEIARIDEYMTTEEIIKKLNANEVSAADRAILAKLFERQDQLKAEVIRRDLDQLKKEVDSYEKVHPNRVKKYIPAQSGR